ncbi:MAG TPA: GGDEF domain-containing protein [Burkholderiales bacterium]|nr:GGDEF domain-containing protein [Burkholderiales bacterium]
MWSTTASVLAVMVLVFAALISSWIGLDAEARGRAMVAQALQLEHDVAEARALAARVAALQSELALDALRGERLDARNARVLGYREALRELRASLARVQAAPLDAGERVLFVDAQQSIEQLVAIHASAEPDLRASSRVAKLAAAGALLDAARPVADRAMAQVRALERSVASRAADEAEEANAAAHRARELLILFGGSSLLLALILARRLTETHARRAELVGQLAELARVDTVTEAFNRRVWDEELARGLERARRTGRRCSVALIDLDHFKRYNDTHGHQRGDALLRAAAQAFATRLRGDDLIARFGGDEFAVLLHGCDLERAIELFGRLQNMLPGGQTFSAGITDSEGREDSAQVLARSDEALYRAKELGRNRSVGAPAAGLRSAA